MTSTAPAPAPAAARGSRRGGGTAFAARLLRTEIRHSGFVWALPLLALLFLYDPFRTADGYPFVWTIRASVVPNKLVPDFFLFAAGFSAWAGSREGRRRVGDLLSTTVRPAWTRQLLALAGTWLWVLAGFLAAVAVLYVRTATVVTWGGPPLWPAVVGAVELTAVCAVAFTAGALFPGRFTAPVVAVGLTVLSLIGFKQAVAEPNGITVLSPAAVVPASDAGVFYPVAPDVPIVQVMFMAGLALAALGVLGLSPRAGGAGWRGALDVASGAGTRLRAAASAVLAVGVAAAVAGAVLASTSTAIRGNSLGNGVEIPALHDAASGPPVPYTPVCGAGRAGFQICVHPAFRMYLSQTEAALDPVIAEIAGLPGAPARATQVAGSALPAYVMTGYLTGNPTAYKFSYDGVIPITGQDPAAVRSGFQQDLVNAFVSGPPRRLTAPDGSQGFRYGPSDPAQNAVAGALLAVIGWQPPPGQAGNSGPGQSPQQQASEAAQAAASKRFAALPAATRRAWLAGHLTALRAGRTSLGQIP